MSSATKDEDRKARLAAALRENLKRRKKAAAPGAETKPRKPPKES